MNLLADLVLLMHGAFIVFVMLGGLLVLRWHRLAWLHLPCAAWGILIELTGWICPLTPLENRLEDLYSLMQVVDQRLLGPLWRYLADYHLTDDRGKVLGYRNLSDLRRRLAPVMLRRDRRLVSDQLPERIEQRLDI